MYIDKKVIFKSEQVYLDSVYVFEDGDFILFGVPDNILIEDQENKKIVPNSTKSAVFDKKSFKPKSILDISSLASFFNFANDEFAICKDSSSFEIYKFNNNRTSYTQIQTFPNSEGGSSKDIKQLANGDILMSRVYVGYKGIYVYRKNENNPKYAPYGEKFLYSFESVPNERVSSVFPSQPTNPAAISINSHASVCSDPAIGSIFPSAVRRSFTVSAPVIWFCSSVNIRFTVVS